MSPSQTRHAWEVGSHEVLLAGGASLPENDRENRLRDLWDECRENHQIRSEAADRILELLRLGPRKAWENEVDRGTRELVALRVAEAWPDLPDEAWAIHQRPAETAREVCRLLHDKFDVSYLADVLVPWHPGGGPRR
jgi:hypothetical protein